MKKITNILITGKKSIGKSYVINRVLGKIKTPYCGYRTLVYEQFENGNTYKIVSIKTNEFEPISTFNEGIFRGKKEVFDGLGAKICKEALDCDEKIVLLDEIGRFEKESKLFLDNINKLLDSEKIVIGVLKKENLEHIEEMKKREDSILFDLDVLIKENVEKEIYELLKTYR